MNKFIILISIFPSALFLYGHRLEPSGFSYYIPQATAMPNNDTIGYPTEDNCICEFLSYNITRLSSIENSKRNVYDLSNRDKEFIRLIEVMSGIECIDIASGHGYGWNTRAMKFSDKKVEDVQDWIDKYCGVITLDILAEARRLLAPDSADDNIQQLKSRIIARKDYTDNQQNSLPAHNDVSKKYKDLLRRIDEKFINVSIHSVYLNEFEQNELNKIIRLIAPDYIDTINSTLSLERLTEIHEMVFRYTH